MVTVQTIAPLSPEEAAVFALEHLPQHPGVGMWCCGGDKACKRACPVQWGGTSSGWETAFSGFISASQKFRKKALVFSDPGKGRVFQLKGWTQEYRINVEKPILRLCIV